MYSTLTFDLPYYNIYHWYFYMCYMQKKIYIYISCYYMYLFELCMKSFAYFIVNTILYMIVVKCISIIRLLDHEFSKAHNYQMICEV